MVTLALAWVWVAGLRFLWRSGRPLWRAMAWAYGLLFVLFAVTTGAKTYYLGAAYVYLLAAGAVAIDAWLLARLGRLRNLLLASALTTAVAILIVLIVTSPGLFPTTVTRLTISWRHPVRAARRPGKAVLVASGPVAGLERLGHVARNRAGEVDVISAPGCSRSQASRASAVCARAAHQHVCASRRRSGSWRSSDAGAGRSRRVPAVPAARAAAGAAARARRCAGRPPWPALRAPAHDGADLPGQPGHVPLMAFEYAGKLPTEGLPDAVHGCAPQAPDTHNDPYTPAIERDVGHDPLIIRVHPARFGAADRTGHGPARSPRPESSPGPGSTRPRLSPPR